MTKPLFFKVTSDHLSLCVFLCLLWGVTDSNKTTDTATKQSPENVKAVDVSGQTETSITLMWEKVNSISTYRLQYEDKVEDVTASDPGPSVTHTVSSLTAGTKYSFTLFTVFEGVSSSGHTFQAVTAPEKVKAVHVSGQTETSITLRWESVNSISTYRLQYKDKVEEIPASDPETSVTRTVSSLTAGTKYNFTLFTVFEGVSSSGHTFQAVTTPEKVKAVDVSGQTETSITLMWESVNSISTYRLQYKDKVEEIPASDPGTSVTRTVSSLTAGTKYSFTLFTVFEGVSSSGHTFQAVTAPENVKAVKVLGQNETSITLMWESVNSISTYSLQYEDKGTSMVEKIDHPGASVTYTVSSLTAGTKYSFTLFTVFEGVSSSGYTFPAVTAPLKAEEFKAVTQNETSITLQWNKVDEILNYVLLVNGRETIVTAPVGNQVTKIIPGLTSGTEYVFSLFTVFENVRSSGVHLTAVTAPRNTEVFKPIEQDETSITLQWNKVDEILNYVLLVNGRETIVTAPAGNQVTKIIPGLTSGTEYVFSLFTVFENVRSSGVHLTAVTAPDNVEEVHVSGRSETSITLMWEKVNSISTYLLQYEKNGSYKVENINASHPEAPVSFNVTSLTAGTKYSFTLFTVFEEVNSTGFTFEAATTPENVKEVNVSGRSETSITLMWEKVNSISTYSLQYENNGTFKVEDIDRPETSVTHEVSSLTAGTNYSFTLFTVFGEVNSTGFTFQAVTDPRNTDVFQAIGQNETSITLQWNKVDKILNYTLLLNGSEINVNASEGHEQVNHTIPGLTSGTQYSFTLFTVFEDVSSSGFILTAVTDPRNTDVFEAIGQNETSITLQWNKVDKILNYTLMFNGNEINVSTSEGHEEVNHTIPGLTSGKKYVFSLFTLFEYARSSGANHTAATVPSVVTSVSVTERSTTNVTLEWNVDVGNDWSYLLQMSGDNVTPHSIRSPDVVSHTFTSLQPGTEYPFSVITQFFGLSSAAYEDSTVTRIDCAVVQWHVTDSSIQGTVEGLFTSAKATNKSQEHVSPGGPNVSFTGLYPGATYEVFLWYNKSEPLEQCRHSLTIIPPRLNARCEYWDAGYSVYITWNKPDGVWTEVEVNVTGETPEFAKYGDEHIEIAGFQPAKTYEVSLASLSGPERGSAQRSEPYVFSCATDPRGVIAGSVFAVLLFAVLVCLILFILLKRPDIISRKKVGSKIPKKKTISVAKFPDHFYQLSGDDNRGFSQEYESLIPVGTEQTRREALLPENKARNRFNNVLPYDWCRVKLTTSNPNATSDYINANYMPGYNNNREYIATQGPLPSTVNDFWRMIWEQRVKGIVMVTNCTEGGRTKCEQYWPDDSDPCPHGELTVTTISEQQEPNWTLREFRVKHSKTSEQRTVRHFHFTAWPDHGVPQGTEVLIQFRGLVRQHIQREGAGAPTVVHCSAGVGRTGTIIALDVLLQQLEKEREVGINAFVRKMRLSRPHMVQTESQYIFLHQCIMDCLQPKEKTEENIYENAEMIYANATALQEFHKNA